MGHPSPLSDLTLQILHHHLENVCITCSPINLNASPLAAVLPIELDRGDCFLPLHGYTPVYLPLQPRGDKIKLNYPFTSDRIIQYTAIPQFINNSVRKQTSSQKCALLCNL